MQLVIDSKFRPFSYDELIKPLMQYKEVYDKVEADYSDLAAQTEQWKDIANQTQSPEAYAMYSKYANDLNKVVDDFSKGMTIKNRGQLLTMKRRYAGEIEPIAKADAAMKEANDLRVKAGPDAIFEVGEYNSLDQFLHGKRANNKYQSRDAITKRTAAMTEAAMASAMRDPEFKKAMGDQYWMITQHTGGSYKDLKAAIANNAQAQNRFAEIKAQVMKDAGYDRYDAAGKQAIEDAINTGLYAGLDKPARSFQANQNFQSDYQKAQLELARRQDARAERQLSLSAAGAGLRYNKSTGKWERDPDLAMTNQYTPNDPNNPNGVPSVADMKKAGWKEEKTSKGKATGRMIIRDKKGKLKVVEKTANGWIPSKELNPDKYMDKVSKGYRSSLIKLAHDNQQNLTPFFFRAWSSGASVNYENYGNNDPNFSTRFSEQKWHNKNGTKISMSPEGGINGHQAKSDIRNFILKFANLENAPIPIDENKINIVADKFFRLYRDTDIFSNNHYKVAFIDNQGNEFGRVKDKNGNITPQYARTTEFINRYSALRQALLSEPSH